MEAKLARRVGRAQQRCGARAKRKGTLENRVRAQSGADGSAAAGGEVGEEVLKRVAETVTVVSKRLRRAGTAGFWTQLVLSTVSAVILAFSILFKGVTKGTDAGLYFILIGMLAGFLSCAWSFGYTRLARQLADSAFTPTKAPPRSQVQDSLQFGVGINLLGLGSTIVGLQATTGLLFAKTLSTAANNPYVINGARNFNGVLALDIFLVQAAANTILSHFLSASISLSLLRCLSRDQQQQQQQSPSGQSPSQQTVQDFQDAAAAPSSF